MEVEKVFFSGLTYKEYFSSLHTQSRKLPPRKNNITPYKLNQQKIKNELNKKNLFKALIDLEVALLPGGEIIQMKFDTIHGTKGEFSCIVNVTNAQKEQCLSFPWLLDHFKHKYLNF